MSHSNSDDPAVPIPAHRLGRRGLLRRITTGSCALIAMVPLVATGAANPPHNVTVNRLIANGPGSGSTSCAVQYQHGNVWAVGYAKIRRGYSWGVWPSSSSNYAASNKRYAWGVSYPNIPDGNSVRCGGTTAQVTVVWNGGLYQYTKNGTGFGWVQAQGPVYSNILGSTGWVAGPVSPGGGQPLASRDFPGL